MTTNKQRQAEKPTIQEFLHSRKTQATRIAYDISLKHVLGAYYSNDAFLELPAVKQEKTIAEYVRKNAERLSGSRIAAKLAAVKSLLSFYGLNNDIQWKRKINPLIPRVMRVADDRAPSREEIQKLLEACDTRSKAIVLVFVSSGMRLEGLTGLKMRDYEKMPLKEGDGGTVIGKLKVYAGTPEKYITFITPEAVKALDDYLETRKRVAREELKPEAPLFRDAFGSKSPSRAVGGGGQPPAAAAGAKQLSPGAVQSKLQRLWVECGVREGRKGNRMERHEFKGTHGFRKFYKTTLANAGMDNLKIETLIGHLTGLEGSYNKPTEKMLMDAYVKHMGALYVTEATVAKEELKAERTTNQRQIDEMRRDLNSVMQALQTANVQSQINELKQARKKE